MSFWSRIFSLPPRLDEQRGSVVNPLHPRDPALATMFGFGNLSSAGVAVTPETALRVAAVYACVRVLSQTIAALPLHVYRRKGADGKERATDHPLYRLLHLKPGLQTSFEWRESLVTHTALRGESFSRIFLDGAGRIDKLELLNPDRVDPFMSNGRVAYRYVPETGGTQYLLDEEVLRIPYLTLDPSKKSMSPIGVHKDTIGKSLVSNEYLATLLKNAAIPKGGIEIPEKLGQQALAALRAEWNQRHSGPENAGNIAIFHGGLKWHSIGMSHDDMQYVELMGLSVAEIARIFGVQPHKIGDLTKATFSNIEQQAIEFVTDTVLPWVRRLEDRMTVSLLTPAEQITHFIAFDLKGLLRGDSTARAALYRVLFAIGALSPNDARRLENMDPLPDEAADKTYIQVSMAPIDKLLDVLLSKGATAPPAGDDDDLQNPKDDGAGETMKRLLS